MILDGGTTTVSSAGTRVQISNTVSKVRWIRVKALAGNSGLVYFGTSDVSATNGYELAATNTIEINFADSGGTIAFSSLYVDSASNNDKVCWSMILEG